MDLTPELIEKIEKTHDTVIVLKTKLLGANGDEDKGLCGDVKWLIKDHSKLKRNVYSALAFLAGSGIIGGGWLAFLK